MRLAALALILALIVLPAWESALANPGVEAERVSRASSLDQGTGAVIISIRSELYLDEPLDVYFLREGGTPSNNQDVVRFDRRQGALAFSNNTLKFRVRAYQLVPGTYRLIAHGMECPTIPAEDERCLIEEPGLFGRGEVSRPSRGYGEVAPSFEVKAGSVTHAGDFVLTARNTIEWGEIPRDKLMQIDRRFSQLERGPEPVVPSKFRLKYALFPRSYQDDHGRRY